MKKLTRSATDRKISGVCGGLAEYLQVDATLLRLLTVIALLFSGGTVLLLYVIATVLLPKQSDVNFTPYWR